MVQKTISKRYFLCTTLRKTAKEERGGCTAESSIGLTLLTQSSVCHSQSWLWFGFDVVNVEHFVKHKTGNT